MGKTRAGKKIDDISKKQESQETEWKWSWDDEYLKWLCGYANVEGGTLYIGVNDDGYVVGVKDIKHMLESIPNKINDKLGILASVKPHSAYGAENIRYKSKVPKGVASKLINQYACGLIGSETLSSDDKRSKSLQIIEKENPIWEQPDGTREYLSIEVTKYPFAISCEGKYYKRSGSTLQELNGFELQKFLLECAGKTWDAVPIPGVGIEDLSKEALTAFRKKAVKNNRMSEDDVNVSDELLLRNLKLMDGDMLTRAAILLFHPEPEKFVTGAYIKIGYFGAIGFVGENKEIVEDLQYHDIADGPLISQADVAINLIFKQYFKALIDYEGIQRIETYMLTRGIVRELLLNAINHKDYATGVPIQVSVYDDRIEIFNMGDWPSRVPSDERVYQKHDSVPHNPKIADVSFRSGDVEAWGRGFVKIKTECSNINAPLPVIDARDGGVSVLARGCEKYIKLLKHGQGELNSTSHDDQEQEKALSGSTSAKYLDVETAEYAELMDFLNTPRSRKELQDFCGFKSRDHFRLSVLLPLISAGKIDLTIPDKPQSPKQRYFRHE